jgi:hypothetical protein
MFRNFDGANGSFGDVSVRATSDDVAGTSIYASLDSANANRMVLVALNKTAAPLDASIDVAAAKSFASAEVHQLTGADAAPVAAGVLAPTSANHFAYTMPAYSVSTLVLTAPEPGLGSIAAIGALALLRRIRRPGPRGGDF